MGVVAVVVVVAVATVTVAVTVHVAVGVCLDMAMAVVGTAAIIAAGVGVVVRYQLVKNELRLRDQRCLLINIDGRCLWIHDLFVRDYRRAGVIEHNVPVVLFIGH